MTGEEFLAAYPEQPGPARDSLVLESIHDGTLVLEFTQIRSEFRGRRLTIGVTSDAAHVVLGDGSRFRPMCSARLLQQIADMAGCSLATELVANLAWEQAAVKLTPCFLPAGPQMVTKEYAVKYNEAVEKKRAGRDGLIGNVGKWWLISHRLLERPLCAVNYGWYGNGQFEQGVKLHESHNGFRVVQPLATAHDWNHEDESQVMQLMSSVCTVQDEVRYVVDVLQDSEASGLLSYDGITPTRVGT